METQSPQETIELLTRLILRRPQLLDDLAERFSFPIVDCQGQEDTFGDGSYVATPE